MADSNLRQRPGKTTKPTSGSKQDDVSSEIENTGRVLSILDIVRVILTLIGASCMLSYYVTSGDSFLWNRNPWFLRPAELVRYMQGPLYLAPEQLSLFNGSDPNLPIYLAINGTVFDVSASPQTYGPGGSYAVFAGKDATRAFVTGCFKDDTTGDLRGAEEIYMFLDDPDEEISSGERKKRAEKERREAKKKVKAEVDKWEKFYRDSKKYFEVGKLRVSNNESEGPIRKLCESANKGRPKRKKGSGGEQKSHAHGKPVQ